MFQVFDSGHPADCHHCKVHSSWNNSKFNTFEEALKYARMWGAPYVGAYDGSSGVELKLGVPWDYSGYGDTIEIREVSS